jgi:Zn ribbon nucleic-acid-binding protein
VTEETERLRRIAAAAPPASSFEGTIQRWRETNEPDYETVWSGGAGLTSY